jgi:hypothetical protein
VEFALSGFPPLSTLVLIVVRLDGLPLEASRQNSPKANYSKKFSCGKYSIFSDNNARYVDLCAGKTEYLPHENFFRIFCDSYILFTCPFVVGPTICKFDFWSYPNLIVFGYKLSF